MRKALFPGTFDPPTFGHLEIITRASKLYDVLIIGIGENISKKAPLLSLEQKAEILTKETVHLPNVQVMVFTGLVVEFAKNNEVDILIRGLRSAGDLDYEMQMAAANRMMGIETCFLMPSSEVAVSSSLIRELVHYGAPLKELIPQNAQEILSKKKGN